MPPTSHIPLLTSCVACVDRRTTARTHRLRTSRAPLATTAPRAPPRTKRARPATTARTHRPRTTRAPAASTRTWPLSPAAKHAPRATTARLLPRPTTGAPPATTARRVRPRTTRARPELTRAPVRVQFMLHCILLDYLCEIRAHDIPELSLCTAPCIQTKQVARAALVASTKTFTPHRAARRARRYVS